MPVGQKFPLYAFLIHSFISHNLTSAKYLRPKENRKMYENNLGSNQNEDNAIESNQAIGLQVRNIVRNVQDLTRFYLSVDRCRTGKKETSWL